MEETHNLDRHTCYKPHSVWSSLLSVLTKSDLFRSDFFSLQLNWSVPDSFWSDLVCIC